MTLRDKTRSALLILMAACLLILAIFAFALSLTAEVRSVVEALPASQRAAGEAAIMEAAADAVRADTRIASWAPVVLWLALVGGLAFDAALAGLALYVWWPNWAAGREG